MKDLTSQLESLDGRIIVLKSARYNGHYIDAHHSKMAKVTGCPQNKLLETTWCKFIVHHLEKNIVCFESIRYPDCYLDMNMGKWVGDHHLVLITKSNDLPKDSSWARFSIIGDDLSNVGIRSERWTNRWLDANDSKKLLGTKHDPNTPPSDSWGRFALKFTAPIQDSYVLVASHYNDSPTTLEDYKFHSKVGMSSTSSTTYTNKVTVRVEAEKNFGCKEFTSGSVKFSAEYSHEWSTSESSTYQEETGIEITVDIPPYKTAEIYQLQATYGPLKVGSNFTRNEEVDGDGSRD